MFSAESWRTQRLMSLSRKRGSCYGSWNISWIDYNRLLKGGMRNDGPEEVRHNGSTAVRALGAVTWYTLGKGGRFSYERSTKSQSQRFIFEGGRDRKGGTCDVFFYRVLVLLLYWRYGVRHSRYHEYHEELYRYTLPEIEMEAHYSSLRLSRQKSPRCLKTGDYPLLIMLYRDSI